MTSLKCWLLLCCVAASHQLSIREFEVPNAVQAGQDVALKCSYELDEGESEETLVIKWLMSTLGTDFHQRLMYQRISRTGNRGLPIMRNIEIKENDSIVLLNVTPAESGMYNCEVATIEDDTRRRQELIVFTQGTGPELNVTTVADGPDEDEEHVLLECAASGVSPRPDFVLTFNGTKVNLTKYVVGPDANGLYEIYGNTTVSMAEADGVEVRCELVFIHPNITHQPYVASKLLSYPSASRQLSIKGFEVPNAVQAGQDVELKCSYKLRASESEDALFVKWWLTPLGTDNYRRLFYLRIPGGGIPGFSVQHHVEIKEHDSIVLLNVTPAESGIYECEVSNIDETRIRQELIVFTQGTGPELNVTTVADGPDEDEEHVLLECAASGVSPRPDFVLTFNGTKVNLTKYVVGPDANGLYEIYGNTTVSMAEADGVEVRCELVFIHPNITHQPYVASKLLSYPSASRQLSIKGFEVPNAVQAGQDVELKCSYKLRASESEDALFVKWWLTPLGTDNYRRLFYLRIPGGGIPGFSKQHHVEIKEHDSIVLLNVTPAESGIYECEVSNFDETRIRHELIVFTQGTGPELNVTTVADGPDEDEEHVLIECAASGVAPRPDFVLTVNGTKVNLTKYVVGPDANGLYEIYGNTTVSMAEADVAEVRCELVFIHPNITHQPYIVTKLFNPSETHGNNTARLQDTSQTILTKVRNGDPLQEGSPKGAIS